MEVRDRIVRIAHHLAMTVDARGNPGYVTLRRAAGDADQGQRDPAPARPRTPDEGRCEISRRVVGGAGEADDVAALVDHHWRVPVERAVGVGELDHATVVPQHGMSRADAADRESTGARDADDLTAVIEGRRRAGGIAGRRTGAVELQDRQFPQLAVTWPPYHGSELQQLRGAAGRIVHAVLRPACGLTEVVGAGGEAVGAAGQRWQRPHVARERVPYETQALLQVGS